MTFHFYITDLIEGTVKGTDDIELAATYASSEEHFVVDAVSGKLLIDDTLRDIKNIEDLG